MYIHCINRYRYVYTVPKKLHHPDSNHSFCYRKPGHKGQSLHNMNDPRGDTLTISCGALSPVDFTLSFHSNHNALNGSRKPRKDSIISSLARDSSHRFMLRPTRLASPYGVVYTESGRFDEASRRLQCFIFVWLCWVF